MPKCQLCVDPVAKLMPFCLYYLLGFTNLLTILFLYYIIVDIISSISYFIIVSLTFYNYIIHKIIVSSLAYINRSFDVRELLPQFYRCINLASMAAVECAVVVV